MAMTGLAAWLWQRGTSMVLAVGTLGFGVNLILAPPPDYATWRAWWAEPWVAVSVAIYLGALLIHAWVGVRDVVLDYVRPLALRVAVLGGLRLILYGYAVWGAWLIVTMGES